MAEAVYILCTLTSLCCACLLMRAYGTSHLRLLFWSALCFFVLAIANALLFVDLIIWPDTDLIVLRTGITLVGLALLLYGLIFETS
ncbi:MAG TPA: DUF5985 family protein [Chthoniobacteraceae bacterium]|jgi:hypothetical protein